MIIKSSNQECLGKTVSIRPRVRKNRAMPDANKFMSNLHLLFHIKNYRHLLRLLSHIFKSRR